MDQKYKNKTQVAINLNLIEIESHETSRMHYPRETETRDTSATVCSGNGINFMIEI